MGWVWSFARSTAAWVMACGYVSRQWGWQEGNLTKAAFAKARQYLKAVAYVVSHHHAVVSPLIIIPATCTCVVRAESIAFMILIAFMMLIAFMILIASMILYRYYIELSAHTPSTATL